MNVLDEIVATKRKEIDASKAAVPLEALMDKADALKPKRRPFKALFDTGPVLIAEIKPKSPSEGALIEGDPLDVADIYAKSAADVVSVLTDAPYFGGSLQLLKDVRSRVPQPVLRKDFIVDEYQVYETLMSGADAHLLIAAILSTEKLTELLAIGNALGLDALVEVHDYSDLQRALAAGAEVIGINNRDLKTLEVDVGMTERLIGEVPEGVPVVSESGVSTAADVRRVRSFGARGILSGTAILRSKDPLDKIKEFKEALA